MNRKTKGRKQESHLLEQTARQGGEQETQTLYQFLSTKANLLRQGMTVGLQDASALVDEGLIVLFNSDGPVDKDNFDSDNDNWRLSVEAVLLLHVFEPDWFHAWQSARRSRN